MRDWEAFVRARLRVDDLSPSAGRRVVRELAAQLEDVYRDAKVRGADDADADAFAQAQIGDWTQIAADIRAASPAWRLPLFDRWLGRVDHAAAKRKRSVMMALHFVRDVRYAVRQLVAAPGFALVAILTIALGIGASAAMFSVVNGVLLRPLPYAQPDRLVRVREIVPKYGVFTVAPANFLDWRQQTHAFSRLAAFTVTSATFMAADGPDRVPGISTSADLFQTLGINPLIGATFTREHERPGAAVIVISAKLWRARFGSDPAIVGRAISVNGVPTTVLGVMPPDFYFPTRAADFWQPLAINPASAPRGAHFLGVVGRLADGVDLAHANEEIKTVAGRLAAQYPDSNANESADVVSLKDQIVGNIRPTLLTLFGAVGLVVLIGCMNVANLLLVRGAVREREIAVRRALGAGRARVAVQLLTESLVLAIAGGALGVVLGQLALEPIRRLGAQALPRVADITMDAHVLVFAAAASCLTALIFGVMPAWQASHPHVASALTRGGSRSATSHGRTARTVLLVAEVALSLVLVTGAFLLLRSFTKLTNVDAGFDASHVLAFQVSLPPRAYPAGAPQQQFYDALASSLQRGDVTSVGFIQTLPLVGGYVLSFDIRGRAPDKPGDEPSANYRTASAGYFETLHIRVLRGRAFTAQDTADSQPVMVVDDAFARKYFGDRDPIGQSIRIGNGHNTYAQIVGVVGDVHQDALDTAADPTVYVPFTQDLFSSVWGLVRTTGDPAALTSTVRAAVRAIDPSLPAYGIRPLEGIVHDSIALRRFAMFLILAFAVATAFLAAVGLYGVMAYAVTQRTREFAVRMAIGASPADVTRLVIRDGLTIASGGIAAGLAAALALVPLIKPMLFGIPSSDIISYLATIGVLLVISLVATYVPARRVFRINPIVAMQQE
jgi:predicted permease